MVFIFLLLFIRAFLSELHHQTLRMEEQQLCHWAFIQQQIITMLKLISLEHIIFYAFTILNSALINFLKCMSLRIFFSAWLLAWMIFNYFLWTFLYSWVYSECAFFIGTHMHMIFSIGFYPETSQELTLSRRNLSSWFIESVADISNKSQSSVTRIRTWWRI